MAVRAHLSKTIPAIRGTPRSEGVTRDTRIQTALQWLYDAGLAVCVMAVPLTMAGIRDYGVAVFVLCSLIMGIAWASQQLLCEDSDAACTGAEIVGLLAIGLVWLQLQPLSPEVIRLLSPFSAEYLSLEGGPNEGPFSQSPWKQISLTPDATRSGLVLLIAYVIFFLTLVQRLQTHDDIDRVMRLIALSAVTIAVLAIGQLFFGNGRFLWLIEHPYSDARWPAKGTFTNPNHFAHFMALGLGPLLWWWKSAETDVKSPEGSRQPGSAARSHQRNSRRTSSRSRYLRSDVRPHLLFAAAAVVVIAGLLSMSRGGIAALVLVIIIAVCGYSNQWKQSLRLMLPLAGFVFAAILAFGTDELTHEWHSISQANSFHDIVDSRWELWTALSRAIPEFLPAGSGVGSHADVYPMWLSLQTGSRFTHAENGYLQVLLELGLPGFLLLLAGIGLCAWWCGRTWLSANRRYKLRIVALSGGLMASAAHSLVDFPWYIPGCMILTLVTAACACRCHQIAGRHITVSFDSRARLPTLLAGLLIITFLPTARMAADTFNRQLSSRPFWESYQRQMRAGVADTENGKIAALNDFVDSLIADLEQCLRNDPHHHAAHSVLAPLYLQRFEVRQQISDNRLTLRDVRDTVQQSDFASTKEIQDWLFRAFGTNAADLYRAVLAARHAMAQHPLRGESYVVLAETGFLGRLRDDERRSLIGHAVRLRPNEPRVLFAAGLLAESDGDTETAWDLWKQAATLDSVVGHQIINRFAKSRPPTELIQRLAPGPEGYWLLFDTYKQTGRDDHQRTVAKAFVEAYTSIRPDGEANADVWIRCSTMLAAAGRPDEAVECLRQAVRRNPESLPTRRRLAIALAESGHFEEASRELSWLRVRLPNDSAIAATLKNLTASRISDARVPESARAIQRRYPDKY